MHYPLVITAFASSVTYFYTAIISAIVTRGILHSVSHILSITLLTVAFIVIINVAFIIFDFIS